MIVILYQLNIEYSNYKPENTFKTSIRSEEYFKSTEDLGSISSDSEKNNLSVSNVIDEKEELKSVENIAEKKINTVFIEAPLVGTKYLSSKPEEPQFVNENDFVKKGQVICIIEAMKIFNEIESEYSGKVIEILVKDGEPVEYGQPLFSLKEN